MQEKKEQTKNIELDGSQGEGGGQILRTALALSLITGKPFSIERIRGKRPKPGLLRQHLACIIAARDISGAHAEGAELGSSSLRFTPGPVKPGTYEWRIGSAGSCSLVLQTLLMPLLLAEGQSDVRIEGGTHNGMAPPFAFLDLGFRPPLEELGFGAEFFLERYGFYPAGGGSLRASLNGGPGAGRVRLGGARKIGEGKRTRLELRSSEITGMEVRVWSSGIAGRIGRAEAEIVGRRLGIPAERRHAIMVDATGPGNAVSAIIELADGAAVFTAFGEPRFPLENVAADCASRAERYVESGARVDEYLQDQLLLPMSIHGGGTFTTTEPTAHTTTNMETIGKFLDVSFEKKELAPGLWEISIEPGETGVEK